MVCPLCVASAIAANLPAIAMVAGVAAVKLSQAPQRSKKSSKDDGSASDSDDDDCGKMIPIPVRVDHRR